MILVVNLYLNWLSRQLFQHLHVLLISFDQGLWRNSLLKKIINNASFNFLYLNVLYKRHQFLHGALDFRYSFHPVHNISVIREDPSLLIVHFLQSVQGGVLPDGIRARHVDDTVGGFLGRGCIFLLESRQKVSVKAPLE